MGIDVALAQTFVVPVIGFVVGVMIGLTGIGGGALMTPVLVLGLGLPATTAVGTDLFYASLTKIVGATQHMRQGTANRRVAVQLAVGSVPAALLAIGSLAVLGRHNAQIIETVVRSAIGISLILASLLLARKVVWPNPPGPVPYVQKQSSVRLAGIGALGGVMVGLSSVGSGSLIIALLMLGGFVAHDQLVGTDLTHAVLLVGASAVAHAAQGHVDYRLAGLLLIGSVPGVILGSHWVQKLPIRAIQTVVIVLIMLAAARFLA